MQPLCKAEYGLSDVMKMKYSFYYPDLLVELGFSRLQYDGFGMCVFD